MSTATTQRREQLPAETSASVDARAFLAAVKLVRAAIPRRSALPILQSVLIEASGGKMTVTGTDLEISATVTLHATGELRTCLPLEAVKSIPTGGAVLEMALDDSGRLVVCCARLQVTVDALAPEDFPELPRAPEGKVQTIELTPEDLDVTVGLVPFTGTDPKKPILHGVLLSGDQAVASDTSRLAIAKLRGTGGGQEIDPIIIPANALYLAKTICPRNCETVRIASDGRTARISYENIFGGSSVEMTARLIEGQFPNFQRVIPAADSFSGELKLNRTELVRGLDAVHAASTGMSGTVTLAPGDGGVTLWAKDRAGVVACYEVPGEVAGDVLNVTLAWRFVKEAVEFLGGEAVSLRQQPDGQAKPIYSETAERTHLLMPCHYVAPDWEVLAAEPAEEPEPVPDADTTDVPAAA